MKKINLWNLYYKISSHVIKNWYVYLPIEIILYGLAIWKIVDLLKGE